MGRIVVICTKTYNIRCLRVAAFWPSGWNTTRMDNTMIQYDVTSVDHKAEDDESDSTMLEAQLKPTQHLWHMTHGLFIQ